MVAVFVSWFGISKSWTKGSDGTGEKSRDGIGRLEKRERGRDGELGKQ